MVTPVMRCLYETILNTIKAMLMVAITRLNGYIKMITLRKINAEDKL